MFWHNQGINGSYQHATKDVTLSQATNVTFSADGMGGVFKFNFNNATNWYDNTQGVHIMWFRLQEEMESMKKKVMLFTMLILVIMTILYLFFSNKEESNISGNKTNEPHYRLKVEDMSKYLESTNQTGYVFLGWYNNHKYLVGEIDLVYVKYDRNIISFIEALEKKYITLEELTNSMDLVPGSNSFYKYDGTNGTNELSKDKFSILICDDKIIIDSFDKELKCW